VVPWPCLEEEVV